MYPYWGFPSINERIATEQISNILERRCRSLIIVGAEVVILRNHRTQILYETNVNLNSNHEWGVLILYNRFFWPRPASVFDVDVYHILNMTLS